MGALNLKKSLVAAALTGALALAAGQASAQPFNDFDVDPSNWSSRTLFTADKITGNYVETITLNADNTFSVSLLWEAGQFVRNDGTTPLNAGTTGLGVDYGLYALYLGSGTFSTTGSSTTFTTDPGSGTFSLFLDQALDTTFSNPLDGTSFYGTGNDADDILLATGTPQEGAGTLDPTLPTCGPGINCGSFGTSVSFTLTDDGMDFFVDPVPFYNLSFQSGQFNIFDVTVGTQETNGSLDAVFETVPEPGTVALLGLAALGLAAGTRRRAS